MSQGVSCPRCATSYPPELVDGRCPVCDTPAPGATPQGVSGWLARFTEDSTVLIAAATTMNVVLLVIVLIILRHHL